MTGQRGGFTSGMAIRICETAVGVAKLKNAKPTLKKLKVDCWTLFSQYIRLRDCLKTTGCTSFGLCITCSKRYHYKLLQAGHFIPGRHNANLFNERGCHAQCYNCNINLRGNTLEYRRRIIELYGEGADEELEQEAAVIRKFTVQELEGLKEDLKRKIKELGG
jgi:hypothetical protein